MMRRVVHDLERVIIEIAHHFHPNTVIGNLALQFNSIALYGYQQ